MRSLLLFLGLLLFGALPALAQQDDDAPALPNIAPREVEIRGQLDITLPALQRPALSGLLPQTQQLEPLPPLPPPDAQALEPPASTPQALADEAAPSSGFSDLPAPRTGLVEAGGGRYFSRFARARFDAPLSAQWAVRSRLDYNGTNGFQPFDDEDVDTSADVLSGRATLRTERDALSASFTGGGFLGQHRLYGADGGGIPSANQHPGRDRYGGHAALHLQTTAGRAALEARARYDGAQVQTTVSDAAGENVDFGEQRVRGTLNAEAPVAGAPFEADVRGSTARLTGSDRPLADGFDGAVSFLDAGAGAWLLQSEALRVFAGARVMTFASPDDAGGTYVAPELRAEWRAAPRLTLYARTDPRAEANLLADRHRENPSLLRETSPQPTIRTIDAEGGVRAFPLRALEVHAFGGYRRAPSVLFYEEAPGVYERGITAARYGDGRILRAGGAVSFRRTERLHTSLSVTYRNGTLADSNADIPYFAPVTAEALFAYGFAGGDGRVQLTGSLESPRPTSRSGDEEVGLFADFDVEGTYAITPAVGLVARIQNLAPGVLERYDRYPRPPLVFEGGLRVQL